MESNKISSSFRDPSGFLFTQKGTIYRQINQIYKKDYDLLIKSGLYKELTYSNLLIPHKEEKATLTQSNEKYKVIKPKKIPFISYPYEWSFSQLKDAALTTLKIQKISLKHGMSLKDSSAFNIQFLEGNPILIDSLSFEKYKEGQPWVAYKQFCQHFLAPLTLMSHTDIRLNQLFKEYLDGIPLDLASKLLPTKTKFKPSLLVHIHLHAASQKKYSEKRVKKEQLSKRFNIRSFLGLIESLEGSIKNLKWEPKDTEWGDYYEGNLNYIPQALKDKATLVEDFLNLAKPKNVWDLGGNTGLFSRIASNKNIPTISSDIDPAAVEVNYQTMKKNKEKNILPLLIDLTNPSPAIGWENNERDSFLSRGPADTVLALALIHHLAISNNLPLENLAKFFSSICRSLIVEFIPKDDSQVQKLLSTREDIFPGYTKANFESVFSELFTINKASNVKNSKRALYLMVAKKV